MAAKRRLVPARPPAAELYVGSQFRSEHTVIAIGCCSSQMARHAAAPPKPAAGLHRSIDGQVHSFSGRAAFIIEPCGLPGLDCWRAAGSEFLHPCPHCREAAPSSVRRLRSLLRPWLWLRTTSLLPMGMGGRSCPHSSQLLTIRALRHSQPYSPGCRPRSSSSSSSSLQRSRQPWQPCLQRQRQHR